MKRNHGIDLMRLVLMFMVVILHVLGAGGILGSTQLYSANYMVAWLLESLAYCAVNCFALITGYVYYESKQKYSSLVVLWLQTVLYSVGVSVCVWILRPDMFSWKVLLNMCFPVMRNTYWYVSCYFGLFLMIPILNSGVRSLSEQQCNWLLLIMLTVFTVFTTLSQKDAFLMYGGYSVMWLVVMYLAGAIIRKNKLGNKISSGKAFMLYLAFSVLSCGLKLGIEAVTLKVFGELRYGYTFVRYTSPTIVLAAFFLFLAFKNMKICARVGKMVSILASASFGIYLIHMQKYMAGYFIINEYTSFAEKNAFVMVGAVLLAAFVIFAVCLLIDLARHYVFQFLKIKERISALEEKIFTGKIHN